MARHELVIAFAPQDFREVELFALVDACKTRGARPLLASTRSGVTRGMAGECANAETCIDWIAPIDVNAIAVIGGTGAEIHLWNHPGLRQLLRSVDDSGGAVAGAGRGTVALARAGVLKGQEVSAWPHAETLDELRRGLARLSHEPVVRSGRLVTLSDPKASDAWANALLDAMSPGPLLAAARATESRIADN